MTDEIRAGDKVTHYARTEPGTVMEVEPDEYSSDDPIYHVQWNPEGPWIPMRRYHYLKLAPLDVQDITAMKDTELGKYVCVIDGGCLHSPHITITSDGIWRKRPNPAGPSPYVYTSAHRDCYVRRILLKET